MREECAKAKERALKLRAVAEAASASEAEGLVGQVNQFRSERRRRANKAKIAVQRLQIDRAQKKEIQVRIITRALTDIEAGR